MNNAIRPLPFCIGMDVHFGYNGDRYPGRVVALGKSGYRITVECWEVKPGSRRDRGMVEGNWDCDFQPAHQGDGECPEPRTPILVVFTYRPACGVWVESKGFARLGFGMCYAQNPCI